MPHLQRSTANYMNDLARVANDLHIRRPKKANVLNKKRIKSCIARFDTEVRTRAMSSDSDDEPPTLWIRRQTSCLHVVAVGHCAAAGIRQLRSVKCVLLLHPRKDMLICVDY